MNFEFYVALVMAIAALAGMRVLWLKYDRVCDIAAEEMEKRWNRELELAGELEKVKDQLPTRDPKSGRYMRVIEGGRID